MKKDQWLTFWFARQLLHLLLFFIFLWCYSITIITVMMVHSIRIPIPACATGKLLLLLILHLVYFLVGSSLRWFCVMNLAFDLILCWNMRTNCMFYIIICMKPSYLLLCIWNMYLRITHGLFSLCLGYLISIS